MRSFVGQTADLTRHGPIIKVKIVAPQHTGGVLTNGKPAPSIEAVALIDTGSNITSIPYGAAKRLGLTSVGKGSSIGFSGPVPVVQDMYHVRFLLPHAEGDVTACEELYEETRFPYNCVIGRDILKYGLLFYDGTNGTFSLTL